MSAIARLGLSSTAPALGRLSDNQSQTERAFSFKWAKRETYDSSVMKERTRSWLVERYCAGREEVIDEWLRGDPKIILDAGCGSGFSAMLLFGDRLRNHDYLGVDISDAIETAKERFLEAKMPGDFLKANVADLPIPEGSVDLIFAEGVLHHTDDTASSVVHLASKLKPNGRFLFYVYAKKGAIREFTDDYIRQQLKAVDDEMAWQLLLPLSKLGKAIGELNIGIDVPEDVPMLGIKAGRIDLQRFFYWNVLKAYYAPELTLEEMNHINFDWHRPLNCHRHTVQEVREFCARAMLQIEHLDEQPSGITVVASRERQAVAG